MRSSKAAEDLAKAYHSSLLPLDSLTAVSGLHGKRGAPGPGESQPEVLCAPKPGGQVLAALGSRGLGLLQRRSHMDLEVSGHCWPRGTQ